MKLWPVPLTAAALVATTAFVAAPSQATPVAATPPLDLGPAGLSETRATTTVEPGVTLTTITRGSADASVPWVIEVSIPSGPGSPDPDAPARSIQDEASARAYADRLTAAGFPAEAQRVDQPAMADVPAGVVGWRVRLRATFADKAAADATLKALTAAGFAGRSWYAGWDGTSTARGPWVVRVVTIDPTRFHGTLAGTYGPDLETREKTTWLAAYEKASVAINAGFFVFDPAAGAEGDPAGAGVYGGKLLSEPIAERPVLKIDSRARHTAVVRPRWTGTVTIGGQPLPLDGIDRVPGLIRNCGGTADDQPTASALHDFTCTDADELVLMTPEFGPTTPAGAGAEAILDRQDRVVRVATTRGVALAAGQRSLQGIGTDAALVAGLTPGERVRITTDLTAPGGSLTRPGMSVINGGPELVRDSAIHITQRQDGMLHPHEPSFGYGWVLQRNPRTFAGVDAQGRTLLVTVDGRQLTQLGLSIPETAAVAKSLGMVDAINLDGGGSTAMAIDGRLVSSPSDAAGERAVGDAIVVR